MRGYMLLDLLYPKTCPICGKIVLPKGADIHSECRTELKMITEPFCTKCGRRIYESSELLCEMCTARDYAFDAGRCTFVYRSKIAFAIKSVKNEGTKEYVDFLCKTAFVRHRDFIAAVKPDVICPVPTLNRKKRVRGYNQSELLAYGLSALCGLAVVALLLKTGNTKDQKDLNRKERMRNLADAFTFNWEAVNHKVPERVLLVDDIYTTGSTMDACAKVLKAAGVKNVYYICLAAGGIAD